MADNITLKRGDILCMQGEVPRDLCLLQTGSMEILRAPDEYTGLDRTILVSKSIRTGVIRGKCMLVGFSDNLTSPSTSTLRAMEDCVLSRYPLGPRGFPGIAAADSNQAAAVLKQLYGRYAGFSTDLDKAENLKKNISRVNDNFSILYKELTIAEAVDYLDERATGIYEDFSSNGGTVPQVVGAKFLVTDNSAFIQSRDEIQGKSQEQPANAGLTDLVKKILKADSIVLVPLLKSDPSLAVDIFKVTWENIDRVTGRILDVYRDVSDELTDLFGEKNSWASFMVERGGYSEWENTGRVEPDFLKNLLTIVVKINGVYEELSGRKLTEGFPGVKKIHAYFTSRGAGDAAPASRGGEPAAGQGAQVSKAVSSKSMPPEMKKSLNQIFEFSMASKDFQNQMIKILNEFRAMKNPFNTETDGRKIRRHITKMYWELYQQVYNRMRVESSAPMAARLMLNFGYLDERFLEEFQVAELTELVRRKEEARKYPVFFESEFLALINSGQEVPSITEMGLSYEAHLREEDKHSKAREKGGESEEDENLTKTLFEIDQRLKSTAAVCSGSTSTAFPILNSYIMKGSMSELYVSKNKVEKIIQEILEIDFSAFWRETVLKIGDAREIIQEEILPYLILIPIAGSRTLMWQELSGIDKRSRGRIVIPVLFSGDLKKHLAHTVACFRWELNRTIKGQAMWADPIEGGVTGEYFDYVNTYKKMSALSQETKDKIAGRFKSLRTNRDRFADDYLTWIFYEVDGIMKLNPVVRAMFFKHIPFRKEVRDKLEAMPTFAQPATRYKNVSKKAYDAYERRFRKYQNEEGKYTDGIDQFMKFLKM